jgi:hypothetical protein
MQLKAGLLLQVTDDAEEVAGVRITARAQHADDAFRRCASRRAELLEADRRLDVVAQNRFACIDIAGSMVLMPSRSSASAKAGSPATRFRTSSLKSRVTAIACSLSSCRRLAPPLVIRPQLFRPFDVALLALLGAAREEDHQRLAVAPEIHPVARP